MRETILLQMELRKKVDRILIIELCVVSDGVKYILENLRYTESRYFHISTSIEVFRKQNWIRLSAEVLKVTLM